MRTRSSIVGHMDLDEPGLPLASGTDVAKGRKRTSPSSVSPTTARGPKRCRTQQATPSCVPTPEQQTTRRLNELTAAYASACAQTDTQLRTEHTSAATKLALEFCKEFGSDSVPRMSLSDPQSSWAQLSTTAPVVNEASARLCEHIMQCLQADARCTRQVGESESASRSTTAACSVLAILACGRSATEAVEWLLDHATELAHVVAGEMTSEPTQFHVVACIHNLVYTEQGAERLATGLKLPANPATPKDRTPVHETTKAVLAAMDNHCTSERLQNSALLFCRNLTSHYEGQDAILSIGLLAPMLQAVVNALKQHSKSERLQIHGVSCLKYLTENPSCAKVVIESGVGTLVVKTLLNTMLSNKDSLSVLERAVAFLKNITWAETHGCTTVLAEGGVTCLLATMRKHPSSEAVQEGGVHVLRNLCISEEGELALLAANAIATVRAALVAHERSPTVCLHAMSFFKHVASSDAGAEALLSFDITPLLLTSAKNHATNADVQKRALDCLLNLVFDFPGLASVVAHAARVVAWAAALVLDAEPSACKLAAQLLKSLAQDPSGRLALLQDRDVAKLIEKTRRAPPSDSPSEDDSEEEEDTAPPWRVLRGFLIALAQAAEDASVQAIAAETLSRITSDDALFSDLTEIYIGGGVMVAIALKHRRTGKAGTLALNLARLNLSTAQIHQCFVLRGGIRHLCGTYGLLSDDMVTRIDVATTLRRLLRRAGIARPIDALPLPEARGAGYHDFTRFVNSPLSADVVFVVAGQRFHAHRIILSASTRTEVFSALFERGGATMLESCGGGRAPPVVVAPPATSHRLSSSSATEPANGGVEVSLPDLQPEIFRYILAEVYGEVPVTVVPDHHIVGVMVAADRFLLSALRMRCARQLVVTLGRERISDLMLEVPTVLSPGDPAAAALKAGCAIRLMDEFEAIGCSLLNHGEADSIAWIADFEPSWIAAVGHVEEAAKMLLTKRASTEAAAAAERAALDNSAQLSSGSDGDSQSSD